MWSDPFFKLQQQMRNNPFFRMQEQLRNDPLLKLQEQMRNDPFLKLQEQMRNDPFLKLQEQMRNDPFLKLQEQMRNDPFLKLQEQMRNDPLLKLQEQMRNDPLLKLQKQMQGDLFVKFRERTSLQLAMAIVAEQDAEIESSLAEDSDLASVDPLQKFSQFVSRLYDVIRDRIHSAQTISELFNVQYLVTTIISAAALYYAMQSANTEDIDKLKSSVDQQTAVIREEATASRLQMQETIFALSQSIRQMTAAKTAALGHVVLYRVKRTVDVKHTKALKAETIGVISVGQIVSVTGYEKNWVRIEAVDVITGETISGWVVKKNLKRIR